MRDCSCQSSCLVERASFQPWERLGVGGSTGPCDVVHSVTGASPPRAQGRWGGPAWIWCRARFARPPSLARQDLQPLTVPKPVAGLRVWRGAGTGRREAALRPRRESRPKTRQRKLGRRRLLPTVFVVVVVRGFAWSVAKRPGVGQARGSWH